MAVRLALRILPSLLIFACPTLWAGAPAPFVIVDKSWGLPSYASHNRASNLEETWTYNRGPSTLMLIRQACSKCDPITQQWVDDYNKHNGNDVALLINHSGTPAYLTFAKAHSPAHIASFGIVARKAGYILQMVVSDKASSEASFASSQELLRIAADFQPKE